MWYSVVGRIVRLTISLLAAEAQSLAKVWRNNVLVEWLLSSHVARYQVAICRNMVGKEVA